MYQKFTKRKTTICIGSKMESGDHSKNGVSLKNQMSRRIIMFLPMLLLYLFTAFSFNLFANDTISFTWTAGTIERRISVNATNGEPFTIDWKSDGTDVQTVTGIGNLQLIGHTYNQTGQYTVTIAATTVACRFTGFTCNANNVTALDVSNSPELTMINCAVNQFTVLDLSNNTKLTEYYGGQNLLTALDVSNNIELTVLVCYMNYLTDLDVSNNTKLTYLCCFSNQLTTLDVSNNTELTRLECHSNPLIGIDVSNNTALTMLWCEANQLTALDVSNNTELTNLWCSQNQLTTIDVSNNTELTRLECRSNQLTVIDVSNNTELTMLVCYSNQLTALDVSNNTALISLNCKNNQLTALDVSNNTALRDLDCSNNQLTYLDLSNNTALTIFYFLTSLNGQQVNLTLNNDGSGVYTLPMVLNNPTFTNSNITYENGNLQSVSNVATYTNFTSETGNGSFQLSGSMNFIYSECSPTEYTITATAGGVNGCGSISPSGAVCVAGGENQTFTFTPNSCCEIDEVFVDGILVAITDDIYTFENVVSNHTIHATFVVTNEVPTVTINGPTFICENDSSATLLAIVDPPDANVIYQWYMDGEAIEGATEATCPLNNLIPRPEPYTFQVTITDLDNGCSILSMPYHIYVNPFYTIAITADKTEICVGNMVQLIAEVLYEPNMIFQWYANGEAILYENTPVCYAIPDTTTNYTFTATQLGSECVYNSNSVTVIVHPELDLVIEASETTICLFGQVTFTANEIEGAIYTWYLNGVEVVGVTTNVFTYISTDPGTFIVQAVATNTIGCTTPLTNVDMIEVVPPPTVSIVGPTVICENDSSATLIAIVAPFNANVIYQWYMNNAEIMGDTAATINIAHLGLEPSPFPYIFCVRVTDIESGCSIISAPLEVIVTIATSISGKVFRPDQTALSSGEVSLYRVQTLSQFILVETVLIGTDGTYEFTNVAQGGYIVKAIAPTEENALPTYYGNNENWEQATLITVATSSIPNVDIIIILAPETEEGDSEINGYVVEEDDKKSSSPVEDVTIYLLKFKNDVWNTIATTLSDATGSFVFDKLAAGKYMTIVDAPGLKMLNSIPFDLAATDTINIIFTITDEGIETKLGTVGITTLCMPEITVYPNPTTGELIIENGELIIENVEVFDIYGKKQFSTFNFQFSIDISHLSAGVYFVKIYTEKGVVVKKVVKN